MPQFDDARVAVFTQNTESVVDGHQVEDGIITHMIMGSVLLIIFYVENLDVRE